MTFFLLQIMLFLQLASIPVPKKSQYDYPIGPITKNEYEFAVKVRNFK